MDQGDPVLVHSYLYIFLLFHVEATFVNYVTVETEKRQSVKVKVKAQWASEDKMREVLKFSATLAPTLLGGLLVL